MSTLKIIAETSQNMPLVLSSTISFFDLHNGNLLCVGIYLIYLRGMLLNR